MDYHQTFVKRMYECLEAKKLDKMDFAARLTNRSIEIKDSADRSYTHKDLLTVETLIATAEILGVSTDFLLGLSDESD